MKQNIKQIKKTQTFKQKKEKVSILSFHMRFGHIQMGKAESDVVKYQDNENYKKVYVQWWVPVRKGANNDEGLYHNYWLNKWKCNHVDPKQWVEISFVVFFFSSQK